MYPLQDKDLDRLSRNAAEHYEMDFGPSGWEQLEKRLDQELPQKKDRGRFLFWLFFIVVTTGSALIGLLMNSQPVTPLTARSIKTAPAKEASVAAGNTPTDLNDITRNSPDGDASGTSPVTGMDQAGSRNVQQEPSGHNSIARTPASPAPANTNKRAAISKPIAVASASGNQPTYKPLRSTDRRSHYNKSTLPFGLNRLPRRNTEPVETPGKGFGAKAGDRGKKTAGNDKIDQALAMDSLKLRAPDQHITNNDGMAVTERPVPDQVVVSSTPGSDRTNTPAADPAAGSTIPDPDKTKNPAAVDAAAPPVHATVTKDENRKNNILPNRGFELGLVAGPDASMVEFGPLYKAGYNFGVQIGYRFNDRWSVNTGIIYTRKYYQADSNSFHAPKYSYISYVKLDKLEGYCAMLDIPLNVRFDFAYNEKRRFFANTGLSSYLMDKQYYDYYYRYPLGSTPHDSAWQSGENVNYFFSIANLSVGYERMIGKHISIQAEPYLKIPLKGLGYGSMKMGSYGIYFSLKYRPQLGARRSAGKK